SLIDSMKRLGVKSSFSPNDLVEKANMQNVVTTLLDLALVARQNGYSTLPEENSSPAEEASAEETNEEGELPSENDYNDLVLQNEKAQEMLAKAEKKKKKVPYIVFSLLYYTN